MAKTKTPFLSMGSQGTIGDVLTSQKHARETLIRTKPTPANPRSLPQMYQRWLYEDYAYLWTQQSAATKQAYATQGSHLHLTGFQTWMRYNLIYLPNIALMLHLDHLAGALVIDFSRFQHTATVFGATPVDGVIANGLLFDGINDRVVITTNPVFNLTAPWSLECFVRPTGVKPLQHETLFNIGGGANRLSFSASRNAGGNLVAMFNSQIPGWLQATVSLTRDAWSHVCINITPATSIAFFFNGAFDVTRFYAVDPALDGSAIIGYSGVGIEWLQGHADHFILHTRHLDATEILRHSLRRYPLQ